MSIKIHFNSKRSLYIYAVVLMILWGIMICAVFCNNFSGILIAPCPIWMFVGRFITDYIVSSSEKRKRDVATIEYAEEIEKAFRSQAFDEYNSQHVEKSAYARAIQEAMGDEKKILPLYMKFRTADLMKEQFRKY